MDKSRLNEKLIQSAAFKLNCMSEFLSSDCVGKCSNSTWSKGQMKHWEPLNYSFLVHSIRILEMSQHFQFLLQNGKASKWAANGKTFIIVRRDKKKRRKKSVRENGFSCDLSQFSFICVFSFDFFCSVDQERKDVVAIAGNSLWKCEIWTFYIERRISLDLFSILSSHVSHVDRNEDAWRVKWENGIS